MQLRRPQIPRDGGRELPRRPAPWDKVVKLLVCLWCLQVAVDGDDGPSIAIATGELWDLFGSIFEARARLRFAEADIDHPFGRWERLED